MKMQHGWAFPDLDEFMANELHADGTYQGTHFQMVLPYLTDRSMAIDGGAHVGTWSRLMAQEFARVIAVEPSADTYEALLVNLATFACGNVEPRNVAIGDEPGTVTMALDSRGLALKNTGARFVRPMGSIPVETIDSWGLPSLGFLKLDIEGSEYAALNGARETLTRCRPIVLFEAKNLWRRYNVPVDGPQRLLTSLGYHELAVAGCDRIWGPA